MGIWTWPQKESVHSHNGLLLHTYQKIAYIILMLFYSNYFFIKYKIISSQNSLYHYLNAKVTFMLIQKLVALTVSAWWRHHWSCVNVRVRCSKIKVLLAIPPAFLLSIAPHVRMLPVDLGRYGELIGNIPNSCFERWEGKLPLTGRISRNIMIFKALFKLNVSFLPRTSTA